MTTLAQTDLPNLFYRGKVRDTFLIDNPEVTTHLPEAELRPLFDYGFFLKHVDSVFERLGLAAHQVIA